MSINTLKRIVEKRISWKLAPTLEFLNYALRHPLDFKKNTNMFKYAISTYKKEEINYVPPTFGVVVSTTCNLRCPTCWYLLQKKNALDSGVFIDVNDFKKVIDRYSDKITAVVMGGGEPLLHPEFDKLVKIVKNKKLGLRISTNGILIKKWITTLKLFDLINVSMDGYNYKTFKQFRGGTKNQFDAILEGLDLLDKYNLNFSISFLLRKDNVHEIYHILDFARKVRPRHVNFININPFEDKKYKTITMSDRDALRIFDDVMSKNDYPFNITLPVIFDEKIAEFKTSRCTDPWRFCLFDSKGNISPCCFLLYDERYGNLFKGYDFNSKMMKDFRRVMIKGNFLKSCIYCHMRFRGKNYGTFDFKTKKWV